jgi:hypothetical protein
VPEGLITLTSAVFFDLSAVRTWPDFAACLDRLHKGTGMSLSELEKEGKALARRNGRFRELKRSTVSELTAEQSLEPSLIGQLRAFGLDAGGSVRGPGGPR